MRQPGSCRSALARSGRGGHRDAGAQGQRLAVVQRCDGGIGGDVYRYNFARDAAIRVGDGLAYQILGLRKRLGGQHRIELGVGLDGLLDVGERGELGHVLRRIHRLRWILVLELRQEKIEEGAVVERGGGGILVRVAARRRRIARARRARGGRDLHDGILGSGAGLQGVISIHHGFARRPRSAP